MEGRHCLSAATVISGLAGDIPSEAAAQESKYLFSKLAVKTAYFFCAELC